MQLQQYSYITVLWIQGVNVDLLLQGRGKITFISTVTAVLFHHTFIDRGIDFTVVSTG